MSAPLTPKELAAEWKQNKFRAAYLLLGEDSAAKILALELLKKEISPNDFNFDEFQGDADAQAAAAVAALETPPMMAERRLVLIRNEGFTAAGKKILAEYLRRPLDSSVLCISSPDHKFDKKDALHAAFMAFGGIAAFKPLSEPDAVKRLIDEAKRLGFELEKNAAEALVDDAGTEWGILRSELGKVKLFIGERTKAGLEDASACLGYDKKSNPFDLPRHLQQRSFQASITLLRKQFDEDGDPFRLLYQITSTINKQLKAKRLAKAGEPREKIFRLLRLNDYYDRDYLSWADRQKEPVLIAALKACLETEVALKSKAWLDPKIELESLVAKICGKQGF